MPGGGVDKDRGGLSVSSTEGAAGEDLRELTANRLFLFPDLLDWWVSESFGATSGTGRRSVSRNCGTLADFLGVFGADRGGVDLDRCDLSWRRLVPFGNSLPADLATSLARDFLGVATGLAFG